MTFDSNSARTAVAILLGRSVRLMEARARSQALISAVALGRRPPGPGVDGSSKPGSRPRTASVAASSMRSSKNTG